MLNLTINDNISTPPLPLNTAGSSFGGVFVLALAGLASLIPSVNTLEIPKNAKITSYRDALTSNTAVTSIITNTEKEISIDINEILTSSVGYLYSKMNDESVSLGHEFEEILVDNLWDMYLE